MAADYDLAIVGSGFAGSLLAMIARRLGRSVVLIERQRHPRFAIGESSTPLANLLLDELVRRYQLPEIASFTKWGTWQRAHPEVACGLKRGFTFYHHELNRKWVGRPDRTNELLVAASPHDAIADTHWYRPDFDHFLVRQAQTMGATLLDRVELEDAAFQSEGVQLAGRREGQPISLRARFVVDASGPRGFLHRTLGLKETGFANLPDTQALYSHFTGVRRWDELHFSTGPPPYPVDDAALHHVFDGGWIWVLRFNSGVTSAGVAMTGAMAKELNLAEGAPAWSRLLERLPSVREQFDKAAPILPFVHSPRLAFRSESAAGQRWALLPSAAGFVDPLLSTGFPLTLLGVDRLARYFEQEAAPAPSAQNLQDYSRQTLEDLDAAAALIGALYSNLGDFPRFTALTFLYFAAASYSESARRLGRAELARSFLLRDDRHFGSALARCVDLATRSAGTAQAQSESLADVVRKAIDPINVAGLANAGRRNWYPALASDLIEAAPKLRANQDEIERLLTASGFRQV